MPRTLRTAKKSTGGSGKRKQIPTEELDGNVGKRVRLDEALISRFCSLCQDGGDLFSCHQCPRFVCTRCIEIPHQHRSTVAANDVQFTCVSCHWLQEQRIESNAPYLGFTRNGQPVLPSFLRVTGSFELGSSSLVQSPRTLYISIHLASLSITGLSQLIEISLRQYFPRAGLDCLTLPFDVGADAAMDLWPINVACHLRPLASSYDKVVFLVTNHTDADTGDLFLGRDENGVEQAAEVDQFLNSVLGPFAPYLGGSTLYFVSCGSMVNNKDSSLKLRTAIQSFNIQHVLAFDAAHLQAVTVSELLIRLTLGTVIMGHEFVKCLESNLQEMGDLGRHSSILHFHQDQVIRYTWAHKNIQPWGERTPVQCPQCGILQKWEPVYLPNSNYSFECKNEACGECGGQGGDKKVERYAFLVKRPQCEVLHNKRKTPWAWLKAVIT
ncbi:hypothetical protein JVU11DRAFT_9335 [Chiua virens]|nr:hypothetical protein JVU11DRAFT_9335 [Chiua virens]